jgi:hypothetical protein
MAMVNTSTKRRRNDPTEELQEFAAKRNKLNQRVKKPKLTAEEYEAKIQKRKESSRSAPNDADSTKENINGIFRKWKK